MTDNAPAAARPRGVSFVIVTHNSWGFLDALLPTLSPGAGSVPWEAIVVDSGSSDPPPQALLEKVRAAGKFIAAENRGFGAANNLGARAASFEALFFLNPDTVLRPDCASRLLDALEGDSDRIVGPSILLPGGGEQASAFRLPTLAGDALRLARPGRLIGFLGARPHEGRRQKECGYLSGAAFMMRAEDFERLGGFDERFFLYHEETDLFARARGLGLQALFYPEAVVVHWGGASTGGSDFSIRHSYRSYLLYRAIHYGRAGLSAARAMAIAEMAGKIAALSPLGLVRSPWARRRRLYKQLVAETWAQGIPARV